MSFRPTFNQIAAIAIIILIIVIAIVGYYLGAPQRKANSTATAATYSSFHLSGHLYELVFNQTFFCPSNSSLHSEIVIPWSVSLNNNLTIVEPSAETVSGAVSGTYDTKYSTIVFSVPDGTYSFTVIPNGFSVQSGTITVNGQDVDVQLHWNVPTCPG